MACEKNMIVRWQHVSSAGFLTSTSLASAAGRVFLVWRYHRPL